MTIRAELRSESRELTVQVRGMTWGLRAIEAVDLRWGRTFAGWDLERVDLLVTHRVDPARWQVVRRFDGAEDLPDEIQQLVDGFVPQPLGLDGLFREVTV